jgi:hypothetical protein
MIDVAKLHKDAEVTLESGEKGIVRGCYMSTEGIVVMVRTSPSGIVDRNVPLEKISEVKE